MQMNRKPHKLEFTKITEARNPKWSKICEGIWCSSLYVKEFDVIVHKNYFLKYNPINFFEVTIRTEVIFRANKTNIFVRHTQVNFRANNLIYWFVGMEVQLPCELTV